MRTVPARLHRFMASCRNNISNKYVKTICEHVAKVPVAAVSCCNPRFVKYCPAYAVKPVSTTKQTPATDPNMPSDPPVLQTFHNPSNPRDPTNVTGTLKTP
eukprot:scaffold2326_cov171-Amphora_coffeaeformis.AAC.2